MSTLATPISSWRSRLAGMPRDGRDTLFLLAVIAWVLLPQVQHLPVWCSVMAGAVLAWRAVLAWHGRPLPGRWWLLALLIATVAATVLTHRTLLGREAGVTLIVVLLTLKTLELRARRDAFVVFFLGFFTMLTNFFHSQSLVTAAAMLIGLLGLLAAVVNAHLPVGRPPLWWSIRTAGWMALLGAPIMLVLFMLFPRLAPLWGIPSDALTGRSGLSATMKVGTIASLALDESIALRIRFDGPPPRQRDLYFRGPVLSDFDGVEWRAAGRDAQFWGPLPANLQVQGDPVGYQVTLEPSSRPWIFVLEGTAQPPQIEGDTRVFMTPELQWVSSRVITDITRYRAQSHLAFSHGPVRATNALQNLVDLPPGYNPRTLALAAELRRDPQLASADALTLVDAVMQRLRTGGYSYTLDPGVFGRDTADEFWFDRKQGFCEHIASSFVVLMRAMDVPARIVTGYQGGEVNAVDGFWTVRQRDAHAWAEVWQAGVGWVRVDPTAAVAPGRVGSGNFIQVPQGAVAGAVSGALSTLNPNLLAALRANWEALNNSWNQWVLNYTQSKQLDLLKSLGFKSPSWYDLSYVLIGIVVVATVGGALLSLLERSRQDPWLRLLAQARTQLARRGLQPRANAPARELATQAVAHFGDTATAVHAWLLKLEAQRYARGDDMHAGSSLSELRRELRRIVWPEARRP